MSQSYFVDPAIFSGDLVEAITMPFSLDGSKVIRCFFK
jgi:hypothetical protein